MYIFTEWKHLKMLLQLLVFLPKSPSKYRQTEQTKQELKLVLLM